MPLTQWGAGEAGGGFKAALESQGHCKGHCRELAPDPPPRLPGGNVFSQGDASSQAGRGAL